MFLHSQAQGSKNTGPRPGAGPWRNRYWAMRNQGQICPKVTGTADIRNTLRVPLSTIIPTGRSMLLRQSKPRSLTESVPWWPTSCNKFACAKHSLIYWGPVRKILPGWNRSAMRKRFPTTGVEYLFSVGLTITKHQVPSFLFSSLFQQCRRK